MPKISTHKLRSHRAQTYRTGWDKQVKNKKQAVEYVNERGFIHFWPIKNIALPSLWTAVAGDRPVADAHDDPGHITWGWKDSLLSEKVWYYAKVLRKKATIISLDLLPYFYALSENYGAPDEDYLTIYEQGRMTQESKLVYEALLNEGPLDTIALRKTTHMTSRDSDSRFGRALTALQADFKILPIGIAPVGSFKYAYIYELTPRCHPDLIDQTRFINERLARRKLAEVYFQSVGAAQERDVRLLFGWGTMETARVLDELSSAGTLCRGVELPGQKGEWEALPELLES